MNIFPRGGRYPALAKEILAMEKNDQAIREKWKLNREDSMLDAEMEQLDKKNELRLHEIIQKYGWPTASVVGWQASQAVWLLVQHGSHLY